MFGSKANNKNGMAPLEGRNHAKEYCISNHKDVSGIDWAHCSICKKALCHDDYFGRPQGSLFWVTGYKCPQCGHKAGNTTRFKNWLNSVVPFDWRALAVPSAQSRTPERP